jgi:hypothetical protein
MATDNSTLAEIPDPGETLSLSSIVYLAHCLAVAYPRAIGACEPTRIFRARGSEGSSNKLKSSDRTQKARKMTQTDWAITAVQRRSPVNPKIAAISATTTQVPARFNMKKRFFHSAHRSKRVCSSKPLVNNPTKLLGGPESMVFRISPIQSSQGFPLRLCRSIRKRLLRVTLPPC